ncbi:hypothetical protein ACMFMF_008334 [Clarireedia jacksonii]
MCAFSIFQFPSPDIIIPLSSHERTLKPPFTSAPHLPPPFSSTFPPPLSPQTNPIPQVDRAHYTPSQSTHLAYEDSPQVIGYGATISAPHMHASAAEYLLPYLGPGKRVLDVGSGSGYLTAVLGELCFGSAAAGNSSSSSSSKDGKSANGKGKVVGLEHIRELRDMGEKNMRRSETGRKWLEEGLVRFVVGDGRKGWVEQEASAAAAAEDSENGWDAIHVGAAAAEIHQPLIDQLRRPGR